MEGLVGELINWFSWLDNFKFGKEMLVFIISMLPLLELRGGLIAAVLLGLEPFAGFTASILGNILPLPFILLFLEKILEMMSESKFKKIRNIAKWIYKKADKNKSQIEKYGYIGLIIFIGIPIPGTGAWTGCLIAALLKLNRKKAFLSAILGVLLSSLIMMIVSYGILGGIIN